LTELFKYYCTPLVLIVTELIAIIIGFIYCRNSKMGRLFLFYVLFDFTITNVDSFIIPMQHSIRKNVFLSITNTLVSLVELMVYYFFFFHILENRKIKQTLIPLLIIFFILAIFYVFRGFNSLKTNFVFIGWLISVIEFLFLLLPCFAFYIELFIRKPTIDLFERPSFWVTTGIFFYAIISIPFYLVGNLSYKQAIIPTLLYYVPFILNFVFLTKAFLCKKPLIV
jgi:hypothetical protein